MLQQAISLNSSAVRALLRAHGAREDVLDAVLTLYDHVRPAHAMEEPDAASDLAEAFRWAEAFDRLLASEDGRALLSSYRHAAQILAAAAARDGKTYEEKPQPALYRRKEERELAVAMALCRRETEGALARGDFGLAMRAVACLRPFVEAFMDRVEFQSCVLDLRENRLRLLQELCSVLGLAGDFGKIEERDQAA
ncbi:MAG TPA: hypothetical protein VFQ27_08730 [Xanthobacteraceae bacterium]|nr:hypothetical protein [Xanthobacteraceae bacterium]